MQRPRSSCGRSGVHVPGGVSSPETLYGWLAVRGKRDARQGKGPYLSRPGQKWSAIGDQSSHRGAARLLRGLEGSGGQGDPLLDGHRHRGQRSLEPGNVRPPVHRRPRTAPGAGDTPRDWRNPNPKRPGNQALHPSPQRGALRFCNTGENPGEGREGIELQRCVRAGKGHNRLHNPHASPGGPRCVSFRADGQVFWLLHSPA